VYFPKQNVEEVIENMNKMAEKKQNRIKTMYNFQSLFMKKNSENSNKKTLNQKNKKTSPKHNS